jgi:hypothetical protein
VLAGPFKFIPNGSVGFSLMSDEAGALGDLSAFPGPRVHTGTAAVASQTSDNRWRIDCYLGGDRMNSIYTAGRPDLYDIQDKAPFNVAAVVGDEFSLYSQAGTAVFNSSVKTLDIRDVQFIGPAFDRILLVLKDGKYRVFSDTGALLFDSQMLTSVGSTVIDVDVSDDGLLCCIATVDSVIVFRFHESGEVIPEYLIDCLHSYRPSVRFTSGVSQ